MALRRRQRLAAVALGAALAAGMPGLGWLQQPSQAADNVVFVTGAFRRSISVADLVYLAETGQARGLMADVLEVAKQKPAEIAKLLKAELAIPLVLTSRLLNTRLGEAVLARVAQIVYPLYAKRVGIQALRAGILNALAQGDGRINAIGFLKAYPVGEMEVNIPALLAVLEKAKSISQLVQFFTDSPLDGLRAPAKPAP
ncbi:MAG: alpha/beta hydrolase [Cyanobacteria bacterium REEB498]|nr:alpha/beta hydrolase [Cyanobacteria bacterium REEB498]